MRHRIGSARGTKLLEYDGVDRHLPKEDINGGKLVVIINEPHTKHLKGNLKKNLEEAKVRSCDDVQGFGPLFYESISSEEMWNEDNSKEDEMFIFDF
jgi:hypothetical protein